LRNSVGVSEKPNSKPEGGPKVLVAQGHVDEARANYDRALAIYRAAYGPDHPQVAVALRQRAQLEMGTRQAVTDLEAALAITTATLGPEHPEIGVEHGNLGAAYAGLHDWSEAEQHYRRAVELHDKTLGPEHAMTAMALTGLGQALVEQKHGKAAIAVLERALAIDDANHVPPPTRALPRWFLVRALWETGTDRSRARALARQAQSELADAADPTSTAVRSELDAWLASHPN
jgi:tetratricopeptide (TPR) repeat protein